MHFEVEKSGILQAVFGQYSKIEGLPREFNWLAIDIICVLMRNLDVSTLFLP